MPMIKSMIPRRYHYFLSNFKKSLLSGHAQMHYSQFGEDILLSKLLPEKSGFYVDVGAHHPKRYSNTYLLYQRGWCGVIIDPNPQTITLFRRVRPADVSICAGIGSAGKKTYYRFSDPAVNTFVEDEAKRWKSKSWITFLGTEEIEIQPLARVLGAMENPLPIDLLTIDAEGMDLEVLESNDWNTYIPKIVIVEDAAFTPDDPAQSAIYQYLANRNYRLKAYMGPSLIFQHAR